VGTRIVKGSAMPRALAALVRPLLTLSWLNLPCDLKSAIVWGKRTLATLATGTAAP
jgi:hypothetical protein